MARPRGGLTEAPPVVQSPVPKLAIGVAVVVIFLLLVAHERESPLSEEPASPSQSIPAQPNSPTPSLPGAPIIGLDQTATYGGSQP